LSFLLFLFLFLFLFFLAIVWPGVSLMLKNGRQVMVKCHICLHDNHEES
jgi:hypothetical protein